MGFVSLFAIAASVAATASSTTGTRPMRLEVETQGNSNILRVIADSSTACTATYTLAVTGSGGNRSVNRATVHLPTRGPVTVATVKVNRSTGAATTATLDVFPCGGKPYQQVWSSIQTTG